MLKATLYGFEMKVCPENCICVNIVDSSNYI